MYVFAKIECQNNKVDLFAYQIPREYLGLCIAIIDLVIMFAFLIKIWMLTYFVRVDSERHRNLLFETQEFSVMIKHLPRLDQNYSIDMLKAELWAHVQTNIKDAPQQI